jgi:pyruvate ferredoxin oxidoreductase beta subunit/2-oxoisovalerate ferredoxin oxidoreductase beta subunit
MSIGLQWLDHALGDDKPILVIPACCGIVTAGAFPTSAYGVPTAASTFASAPAVATGITAIAELNNEDTVVTCWTGDGGTYDIGIATLSAAAERNENILYICYDNEIYGNTGGQRSSATPQGVRTTTTPTGKVERKKDMMAIMAGHRIPYAATLSIAREACADSSFCSCFLPVPRGGNPSRKRASISSPARFVVASFHSTRSLRERVTG